MIKHAITFSEQIIWYRDGAECQELRKQYNASCDCGWSGQFESLEERRVAIQKHYDQVFSPSNSKVIFPSGAASSKIPRYDLIPIEALRRIAARFELGLERHKERSWNARSSQAALTDEEFFISRCAHVIDHALKLIAKRTGSLPDDGDDDAAAIAWGGVYLCAATAKKEKPDASSPETKKI